jgi:hypothetical protein
MHEPLQHSLIDALKQGASLLSALDDDQYTESVDRAFSSCVGSHYRHSLEHFEPLLCRNDDGLIDYDARKRDPRIETARATALERTLDLLARAEDMRDAEMDRPVRVRCSVSTDTESPVVDSTLGREVMYAVIHAVHHYAIIRMLCAQLEVRLPDGFGMAPSTTRHRQALSSS